jgi:hypothetical protein
VRHYGRLRRSQSRHSKRRSAGQAHARIGRGAVAETDDTITTASPGLSEYPSSGHRGEQRKQTDLADRADSCRHQTAVRTGPHRLTMVGVRTSIWRCLLEDRLLTRREYCASWRNRCAPRFAPLDTVAAVPAAPYFRPRGARFPFSRFPGASSTVPVWLGYRARLRPRRDASVWPGEAPAHIEDGAEVGACGVASVLDPVGHGFRG